MPGFELERFRRQKDQFFLSPDSPLTGETRRQFTGLRYFSENPGLKLRLGLDTNVSPEPVMLRTSTGEQRQYRRSGRICFSVQGQSVKLMVFTDDHGFFLPFRDGTCDDVAYAAGRYLEPTLCPDAKLEVDFNLAYNPYCAYSPEYSCPLPPRENWTPVRIEAGELRFQH